MGVWRLSSSKAERILDRLLTRIDAHQSGSQVWYRGTNGRVLGLVDAGERTQLVLDTQPGSLHGVTVIERATGDDAAPFLDGAIAPSEVLESELCSRVEVDSAGSLWHLVSWYESLSERSLATGSRSGEREVPQVPAGDCDPVTECEPDELRYQEEVASRWDSDLWFPDDDPSAPPPATERVQAGISEGAAANPEGEEPESHQANNGNHTLSLKNTIRETPQEPPDGSYASEPRIRFRGRKRKHLLPQGTEGHQRDTAQDEEQSSELDWIEDSPPTPSASRAGPHRPETRLDRDQDRTQLELGLPEEVDDEPASPRDHRAEDEHSEHELPAQLDEAPVDWLDPDPFVSGADELEDPSSEEEAGLPEWLALAPDPAESDLDEEDEPAEDRFQVDLDAPTRYSLDTARLVAHRVATEYSDGSDELQRVLTNIFYSSPWSPTRRAIERCLARGSDAACLANAAALRQTWQQHPEFWLRAPRANGLGEAWQYTEQAQSQLGWVLATAIAGAWPAHPETEEIEHFLTELHDRWKATRSLQYTFPSFDYYVSYRIGAVPGSLIDWPEWTFEPQYDGDDVMTAFDQPTVRRQWFDVGLRSCAPDRDTLDVPSEASRSDNETSAEARSTRSSA